MWEAVALTLAGAAGNSIARWCSRRRARSSSLPSPSSSRHPSLPPSPLPPLPRIADAAVYLLTVYYALLRAQVIRRYALNRLWISGFLLDMCGAALNRAQTRPASARSPAAAPASPTTASPSRASASSSANSTTPTSVSNPYVQIARSAAVWELKAAIEGFFIGLYDDMANAITWRYVWSHFCLCFKDEKLTDDKATLRVFGIKDGDENWSASGLLEKLKGLSERMKLEDLTIGPVLTVTMPRKCQRQLHRQRRNPKF
ncbi:hypothetical protein QYE76_063220 [Lolium multiflorum]|uniref:SNRNP25 ubiquitin-like domain-containing protein n=1 Tax=Lolium multiflorum TaxID=4521 RepID=A0AAD8S598_LOLMU|nr:hypothetical protein QYE76_063220 [Lolium multiflorum]